MYRMELKPTLMNWQTAQRMKHPDRSQRRINVCHLAKKRKKIIIIKIKKKNLLRQASYFLS